MIAGVADEMIARRRERQTLGALDDLVQSLREGAARASPATSNPRLSRRATAVAISPVYHRVSRPPPQGFTSRASAPSRPAPRGRHHCQLPDRCTGWPGPSRCAARNRTHGWNAALRGASGTVRGRGAWGSSAKTPAKLSREPTSSCCMGQDVPVRRVHDLPDPRKIGLPVRRPRRCAYRWRRAGLRRPSRKARLWWD